MNYKKIKDLAVSKKNMYRVLANDDKFCSCAGCIKKKDCLEQTAKFWEEVERAGKMCEGLRSDFTDAKVYLFESLAKALDATVNLDKVN